MQCILSILIANAQAAFESSLTFSLSGYGLLTQVESSRDNKSFKRGASMKKILASLSLAGLGLLPMACKTSETTSSNLRSDTGVSCPGYPLTLPAEAGAEAKAASALLKLAGKNSRATLDWSDGLHTPKAVNNLENEILCSASEDVGPKILSFLDSQPDLFRIDSKEWRISTAVICSDIQKSSNNVFVPILRKAFGSESISEEKLTAVIQGSDKGIEIRFITGNYLPAARLLPKLTEQMKACSKYSEEDIIAAVRGLTHPVPYMKLDQCTPIGPGEYQMTKNDQIKIVGDAEWTSTVQSGEASLSRIVTVEVELAKAALSADIRASDMFCAVGNEEFAGFKFRVDAGKREILEHSNGIRNCHTCLK
jgi:hypothetical protein